MSNELMEREPALRTLASRAAAATEGRGSLLLITGEAGIGKTALIHHFAERTPGLRLVTGYGEPTSAVRPLGVVHDLALALPGALRVSLEQAPPPWRIYEALLDDLSRLDALPVLCVEDAQWADQASLEALRYLLRRCARLAVMVVVTLRIEDPRAAVVRDALLGGLPVDLWDEIALQRLSASAVEQLAGSAGLDGSALYRLTQGNPLFVRSQLRWGTDRVPESLSRLAHEKLAALDPHAAELVRQLCVLPERIPDATLRRLPQATPTAIVACVAQHWIVERDGHWMFDHELLRRAVLDALDPVERARRHAALLSQPLTLVQTVYHSLHANDVDRLRALAPRAAEEAMRTGAYREAAEYWQIALRHADPQPRERARWLDQLGWSLVHSGNSVAGLQASLDGRRDWLTLQDADGLLRNMSSALRWPMRVRAAFDLYSEQELIETLALPVSAGQSFDRAILTVELARRASELGDYKRIRELIGEVRERLKELLTPAERAEVQWWIAWLQFYFLCETPDAALDEAVQVSDALGLEHFVSQAHALQIFACVMRFELPEAERRCAEAIARCEKRDQMGGLQLLRGVQAHILTARGRFAESLQVFERSRAGLPPNTPGADFMKSVSAALSARLGLANGPDGREVLSIARMRRTGTPSALGATLSHAAEREWLAGNDDLAREYLLELAALRNRLASPRGLPLSQPVTAWLAAILELPAAFSEGDPAPSASPGEAARVWLRRGMPYPAAMSLARGPESSRRQALTMLEELGARGTIERLQRYWSQAGGGTVPRGAKAATRRNPGGLTQRELEVLGALTRGLSNSQIAGQFGLSTRTVEHHLAAILSKTGCSSRLEALAWARGNGIGS